MMLAPVRPAHRPDQEISDDLTRRGLLGALAAATALAAAGCGSDSAPEKQEPETHDVEDLLGKTTIPRHPERIVADSISNFAHLVALGVEPVGVAIPTGFSTEYFRPSDDDIEIVTAGDGWTVNLERALTLEPDLILATGAEWNVDNCKRYRDAVATFAFEEGWKDTDHIKERFLALGSAIGRETEAMDAIGEYDATLAEGKETLKPRLAEIGKVGIVRLGSDGWIGVRTEDVANTVLASLGMTEPAWPEVGESGYVELSMETLGVLDRADTLVVTRDDEAPPADHEAILSSPLWQRLDSVSNGRAHLVSAWNSVDLLQLGYMVDEIVRVTG